MYVGSMTLKVICTVLHGVLSVAANWLLVTSFEECPGHMSYCALNHVSQHKQFRFNCISAPRSRPHKCRLQETPSALTLASKRTSPTALYQPLQYN